MADAHESTPEQPGRRTFEHTPKAIKEKILTLSQDGASQSEIRDIVWKEDHRRISQPQVSRILKKSCRLCGHSPQVPETRGRKRKYDEEQLDKFQAYLDEHRDEPWQGWRKAMEAAGLETRDIKGQHKTLKKALEGRSSYRSASVQTDPIPGLPPLNAVLQRPAPPQQTMPRADAHEMQQVYEYLSRDYRPMPTAPMPPEYWQPPHMTDGMDHQSAESQRQKKMPWNCQPPAIP